MKPIPHKMYTEWPAFECRMLYFFYILLHIIRLITRIWLQKKKCRLYKAWNTNFPCFPYFFSYFSEIFRNFLEISGIFRNIIFRKIYITKQNFSRNQLRLLLWLSFCRVLEIHFPSVMILVLGLHWWPPRLSSPPLQDWVMTCIPSMNCQEDSSTKSRSPQFVPIEPSPVLTSFNDVF